MATEVKKMAERLSASVFVRDVMAVETVGGSA